MRTLLPILSALFLAPALGACAAPADDPIGSQEGAISSVAPTTIANGRLLKAGSVSVLRYGVPRNGENPTRSSHDYVVYEVLGTPGDEVDIHVARDYPFGNTAVAILGDASEALAKCETSAYPRSCKDWVEVPVLAYSDGGGPNATEARLHATLTTGTLRIAVGHGLYRFRITVSSVRSALDTSVCQPGTPAEPTSVPVDLVTRARTCAAEGCGPWTERSRERGGQQLLVTPTTLSFLDDGADYSAWGPRLSPYDMYRSRCTATTRCSPPSSGSTTCDKYRDAITSPGRTRLDSDTCSATPRELRFAGTVGARCVSLTAGVRSEPAPDGSTVEVETVVVADW